MQHTIEQLSYPMGKFAFNANADENEIHRWISDIELLPAQVKNAVKGLSSSQLDTPYRDGGWSVRQVIHHIADSHMNAYIRFKLALTEDNPTIKPYNEKLWAELDDSKHQPIELSLAIIEPLHSRWVHVIKKINKVDYSRTVFHPESKREMSIKFLLHLYSWHGKHHTAHINSLRDRNKW